MFQHSIHNRTMYVDYSGSAYPFLERLAAASRLSLLQRFVARLSFDAVSRRNPRTSDYMRRLISTLDPTSAPVIRAVATPAALDTAQLAMAATIVLLWRDANGSGWSAMERHILQHKSPETSLVVVNGRRRRFHLTPAVRRRYLARRLMQKSMIVEFCAFLAFCVLSPAVVIWDGLMNRD